jgi:hypothetical protein
MAGLVPAIHVFLLNCSQDVDARDISERKRTLTTFCRSAAHEFQQIMRETIAVR